MLMSALIVNMGPNLSSKIPTISNKQPIDYLENDNAHSMHVI